MEVVIDQKGEETVIKIKGRLDTNTARECEEKVLPVWENPGVKVCVDCSDLEYVSSAGLRLFLILQKMTTAKKGSLRLIGMRKKVAGVSNLAHRFCINLLDLCRWGYPICHRLIYQG